MDQFLRYCLFSTRDAFLDDLRPKYIMPPLLKFKVLSSAEIIDILGQSDRKSQVLRLLDILPDKGPGTFDFFVQALQYDEAYPWLADSLLLKEKSNNYGSEVRGAEPMQKQLAAGGVPFQTNYLFRRVDLLSEIRSALQKAAKEKRHWVVLHGMLGCGKSVLAAEAVRESFLFDNCFPSGVCWVSVGNFKAEAILQHKLQVLWEKLESTTESLKDNHDVLFSTSDPLKKITRYLRMAVPDNTNFLLVLDDVWDASVIEAFDVGCPILVTSKDRSIFDSVSSYCSFIAIPDKLSFDDCMTFLAPYVKADAEDLPKSEVSEILKSCKGLPLLLGLVGGMMSRYGNKLERWQNLSKEMEKGLGRALKRSRNQSGNLTAAKNMIKLCIDSLSEDLKNYYFDFAIFEQDVFVRSRVLEILWGMSKFDVEDIMHDLYQKSLVLFEEDSATKSLMYSVHDLYLVVLKEECTDLEARHKKLIDCYLNMCKTDDGCLDYGLLPDDGYIHFYIGYHIFNSNEKELFPEIFLNLNFIQNKLRFASASDLLYDFNVYKADFDEVLTEWMDIEAFIRKNAHLIMQEDADIVQLALFEPDMSSVHKNAKKAVLARPGKIYFEWSNQASVPYRSSLNVKLDFENLHCALFSPKNQYVATVGEDTTIVLWDSASGSELEKFTGHTASINCCVFSTDGHLLATASNDKTVKLWQVNYPSLTAKRSSKTKRISSHLSPSLDLSKNDFSNLTFTCHEAEVQSCSFSCDDQLVISGDVSGISYIWEPEKAIMIHKIDTTTSLHSYPITCCRFSYSKLIAAVAFESSIKLWNINSMRFEATLQHNKLVSSFCFAKNDNYLFSASGPSIWQWNLSDSTHQEIYSGIHSYNLCCCSLSPDEQFIASGTSSHSVIVWNITSLKPFAHLTGHKSPVKSVVYSNDGSKLLSASSDGHLVIWAMSECNETSMVSLESNLSVRCNDGLVIASSDHLNCIQVRIGRSGELIRKSIPDSSEISSCSISDNCSQVVYGTKIGHVKVFFLESGETVQYGSHSNQVTYVTHVKNTCRFISCSEDSTLRIWDEEGKFVVLKGHIMSVVMCVLYDHKDGSRLLSCSEDGTLRVWDVALSETVMVLEGHGNQKVTCCDVSPFGKFLCSASTDCTIKIWSGEHGQDIGTLRCDQCVRCCRFSPVPGYLVSGEDSGQVTLWELCEMSRKLPGKSWSPRPLGNHENWVKDIKFSSKGSLFATVSDSIKIWRHGGLLAQTIILPGSFTCALWASPDFTMFVLIHNSVLYVLKSIS